MAAFAHTLKGSARGVGAWRVAEAADAVEATAKQLAAEPDGSLERLVAAVDRGESQGPDFIQPAVAGTAALKHFQE